MFRILSKIARVFTAPSGRYDTVKRVDLRKDHLKTWRLINLPHGDLGEDGLVMLLLCSKYSSS